MSHEPRAMSQESIAKSHERAMNHESRATNYKKSYKTATTPNLFISIKIDKFYQKVIEPRPQYYVCVCGGGVQKRKCLAMYPCTYDRP